MDKLQIAKELLKNTRNQCTKFLSIYIANIESIEKNENDDIDKEFLRLDSCISYIQSVNFDITGFGLFDIPIYYAHVFNNKKTNQVFDLAVLGLTTVTPRYLDFSCCEQDAKSIQEAIEKYNNFLDDAKA